MKKNMNAVDKTVRLVIAAAIAVLYILGVLKGVTGVALLIVGIVLIVTSILGICPLYWLTGLSTLKKNPK